MIRRLRSSGAVFFALVVGVVCWIYAYNLGARKQGPYQPTMPCPSPAALAMPTGQAFLPGVAWTCDSGVWVP